MKLFLTFISFVIYSFTNYLYAAEVIMLEEMKEKHSSTSFYMPVTDTYSFAYGPSENKMVLKKSKDSIGIQPRSGTLDDLTGIIGKESTRFKLIGKLGGFYILKYTSSSYSYTPETILSALQEKSTIARATYVYHAPEGKSLIVPTGEIYVEFKSTIPQHIQEKILKNYQLSTKKKKGLYAVVVQVNTAYNPLDIVIKLQSDQSIAIAEPDLATLAEKW